MKRPRRIAPVPLNDDAPPSSPSLPSGKRGFRRLKNDVHNLVRRSKQRRVRVLSEGMIESRVGHPDEPVRIGSKLGSLRVRFILVKDLGDGLCFVRRKGRDIDTRALTRSSLDGWPTQAFFRLEWEANSDPSCKKSYACPAWYNIEYVAKGRTPRPFCFPGRNSNRR